MRIEFVGDGNVFDGTPKQIIKQMHSLAIFAAHLSFSEYIDWCVANTLQGFSIELKVTGETDDEKAASYVNAILDAGIARKL